MRIMNRNQRRFLAKILSQNHSFFLIFSLIFFAFFLILRPFFVRKKSIFQEIDLVQSQIDRVHENTTYLEEKIVRLEHDPLYIQKVARQKLGMKKPNEIVYKVVEGSPSLKGESL